MDATLLAVKLVATPLVILLIYAIERRWGHAVAGLVFGLPLTSSLATAFLAAEQGSGFARDTAAGMQAGIAAVGASGVMWRLGVSRLPAGEVIA
ncbi:MAG: hypothetical protein AABY18_09425 [Candidatus Thermoplasmatota archaeon]